jgi:hypothetical protein
MAATHPENTHVLNMFSLTALIVWQRERASETKLTVSGQGEASARSAELL